jgi:hypothetical protein
MTICYGVLFICLSAVLFGIELLFFRNPKLPKWADGFVFISICVTAIIGLGSTGLILITFAFENINAIGWDQLLLNTGILGATLLALWFLRIRGTLRKYAAQKEIILPIEPIGALSIQADGLCSKRGRMAA